MIDKPKIQYVREFYNYGTEAKKLDFRSLRLPKSGLPLERLSTAETITLDPVAMVAIVAAIVLLIVIAAGITQIQDDWTEYDATAAYLSHLRAENAELALAYQESFELEEIANKAQGLGLVSLEEVKTMTVLVTVAEPEPEPSWFDNVKTFWQGLWAGLEEE